MGDVPRKCRICRQPAAGPFRLCSKCSSVLDQTQNLPPWSLSNFTVPISVGLNLAKYIYLTIEKVIKILNPYK